jgi:hypothetical protein
MFHRMTGRLLAAAFALCAAAFAPMANAQTTTTRAATVVELYTSQGCEQCPRANRLLGMFAGEDQVLALTFSVSIWDYLGWRDTFAQPEFNTRQRDYSRAMRVRGRYTPQLVFNGASQMSASGWDEARATLDQTRRAPISAAPAISITRPTANRVRISLGASARRGDVDVWIIAFDPGPVDTFVNSGANRARRVYHYNLVRWMDRVGTWDGGAVYFERSRCSPECAVIVQEPNGGRIISAAYTSNSRR